MEALMRWNSAEYGQVPPSDFVPLAERTGAIMSMGAWALETGCQQLERWSTHPTTSEWTLSVNVSAHQFNHTNFAGDVLNLLKRYRIAASEGGAAPPDYHKGAVGRANWNRSVLRAYQPPPCMRAISPMAGVSM
jgi:hypothetical protein